ncbi:MAG: ATP-binding cassette domain-containing protein [Lachnospiraceae bacterium]|nr:ATP-binding cassette domain-containing protein [Lachnospiraceae bacterium]
MSLEVKDLVKKYGDKTVVDKLSFGMDRPGVYALLGTNGAGKTTSMRMMLGILKSDGGSISWNGDDKGLSKINLGYLPEERGLYPKSTIYDQMMYFAKLKGIEGNKAKELIRKWSERLELIEYMYPKNAQGKSVSAKKADELSKGNQQKVQLMATLISNPEFLILDEPLSGLDPINTELFKSVIKEEIAKEKYIILSSHQMATVEEFCSEITILNKGKTVLQGNLNKIKKDYGRVNLVLKTEEDIEDVIKKYDLVVNNKTASEYSIRLANSLDGKKIISELVSKDKTIVKYELREPSLHEIFIEKVGDSNV